MIEGITPVAFEPAALQTVPSGLSREEQVKEEFMTMFYKEMLKQTLKMPKLGPAEEEGASKTYSVFTSDILIEQLARQMVSAARPTWLAETGDK
ncbi:hypothetical protein A3K48_02775 [candidate division WOR-1 bacterium RIFOXYA12_FULL_52_29]|uniref:Uncharacterized protein n=1 Tax=candidate division WOR-1 bacterium RIFOXYC12_FULL_54_18 TaxID=1802584 RepID=A0A1F4T523_UNCSA|nr:MAG: hypothetical protein A3K44_02775 [candidate division WOR-1 bacterium RIFOXYA2_FULL_51_19]OGC17494.1 MAG: hypothetical protein A3K48_02775 [candidate division WOR-1 bacterium RIFOXYA12_FULL_52_29]OGC26352.1 MAG: hypothetical protein A3K32_02770 [candidate division WOR-1 bacterium RIFOXYB2_FULL_45_9]OGC27911.1 MAG: hypothetical protein A3K49_02775 [candidate division WOR-1 bacterium RIFOXYC12_FULL_54_18]OGC29801.1 MAG: hypothetical protein A2346_03560 [candidate division WOR-1 bacterium R